MKITNQKVVEIHYTLSDSEGKVIDSSAEQGPMSYLHGAQNIVPGLEQALAGKTVGDKLSVVVAPEDGYGHKDAALVQELPRESFGGIDNIEVGMEFHAQTEDGMQVVEVINLSDDTVTIDGNHPLAGVKLHFDIEILDVRDATEDEMSHGHIHTTGGCGQDHSEDDSCTHEHDDTADNKPEEPNGCCGSCH